MSDSKNLPLEVDIPSPRPSGEQSTLSSEAKRLWTMVQAHRSGKRFWVRVLLVHDKHYPWSLHECAVMVRDGLRELGHDAYFTAERIDPNIGWPTPEEREMFASGEQQIIIGGNIATAATVLTIPDSAIVYNFEQVGGWQFTGQYVSLLKRCVAWEYHPANLPRLLQHHNITATLVPFGYVPAFTPEPRAVAGFDYDVAFVGSLVPYRTHILNSLRLAGLRVYVSDSCYEEQRADIFRRTKVVLNVHFYPQVKLLEVVRLGLAIAQHKAVVTQLDKDTRIDPYYLPGVRAAKYDEIVTAVLELVQDDKKREQLERAGYELFTARRAADSLEKGLASYAPRRPASLPQSYDRSSNPTGVTYRRISRDGQIR